jgi:hypothetical protein
MLRIYYHYVCDIMSLEYTFVLLGSGSVLVDSNTVGHTSVLPCAVHMMGPRIGVDFGPS